MDIVDESTLDALITWDAGPCVSVYLPTHRMGRETESDHIRFRNLLDRAEHDLVERGLRTPVAAAIVAEGRSLLSDAVFWQHQEEGLAYFAAPKYTALFRLPATFSETVIVGDAFHVKPLWSVVGRGDRFDVLALSRNRIRLLWATRFDVGEIDLHDEIPQSLAEALWFEDPEKQLQLHSSGRVASGRVVATFHGSPDDHDDDRVIRFFRAVDDGLLQLVDRNRPLVLAGVEETVALYRKVSQHPTILAEAIPGNADRAAPHELHAKALVIAEPYFTRVDEADRAAFSAAGVRAVAAVTEAVTAALQGRVAVIFVPAFTHVWGTADVVAAVIHEDRQAGDRDLLDLAAVATWRTGGRVHVVDAAEVPGPGPVAVILRY